MHTASAKSERSHAAWTGLHWNAPTKRQMIAHTTQSVPTTKLACRKSFVVKMVLYKQSIDILTAVIVAVNKNSII